VPARRPLPFDPIEEAQRHWTAHGWPEAAPGMAAVTSVMRVQQMFLARVDEVLRPFGLTFARYEVLMLLRFSRSGALPLGKIGERLQVHAASVTNAVDRLEGQGLVRRRPHPTDGRTTLAAITRRGVSVAKRATHELNREVFAAVPLARRELDRLFGLLQRLRESAGDFVQ